MQNPVFFFDAYKNRFVKIQPQDVQLLRELSQEVFMKLTPPVTIDGITIEDGEWARFKRHSFFISTSGIWVQCNTMAESLIPRDVKKSSLTWAKRDPEYLDDTLYPCFFPQLGIRAFIEGKSVINCAQFVRLQGI
jgi:hypothetical protein